MKKMKLNIQLFGATCTVSVKSITQDIVNNCSTITIHGKLATDKYSWNYGGAYMQPTISNQPVVGTQTSSQTLAKYKYNLSKSDSDESDWTFTVYHYDNGTCNNLTISIAWYVSDSTKGTKTLDGGYTPATIPRASDVSANNGTLNTQMTISITRKDSSFTHTLRYVCGSASGWIQDSSHRVGTTSYWTPPISLANQNKSGNTVSCTIYCQTYNSNGQTVSSEKSTTITLTIPTLNPTASLSSVSDSNSYKNTYGVFIQNKSKISSTLSGTAQYSDINSYSWQIRQTNSSGTLLASGSTQSISYTPTTSGTLYIYGSVTDKRGASNSTSTTISVTAYSAPTCSLTVSRVNSTSASYTMSGSGTPLSVTGYTANVVTYTLTRGATTVRSTTDGTSYTGTDTIEDQSYTYILTASDTISGQTDSKTVSISTTFTLMNFSASGKAMAIGKASEAGANEELLEVGIPTTHYATTTINAPVVIKNNGIRNELSGNYNYAYYLTDGINGHYFNKKIEVNGNVVVNGSLVGAVDVNGATWIPAQAVNTSTSKALGDVFTATQPGLYLLIGDASLNFYAASGRELYFKLMKNNTNTITTVGGVINTSAYSISFGVVGIVSLLAGDVVNAVMTNTDNTKNWAFNGATIRYIRLNK